MSATCKMLLLGHSSLGEEFSARIGSARLVHCSDPYDALLEMGRRHWPAVVLTAACEDFAGLCRASRRLQRDSRLFAICSPSDETEVRSLRGPVLDDYFIYPPTRGDWQSLRRAVSSEAANDLPGDQSASLLPRDFVALVTAARTHAALEACLADMVSRRLCVGVEWRDAAKDDGKLKPLLHVGRETTRLLVPRGEVEIDEPGRRLLDDIQQCLPALLEAAKRTESLRRLAITDHLTGAYNRRYFYHLTDQILLRGRQRHFRVTLLLYDIDDFKRYNDTYGHDAGDEILRETAGLMKRITRGHDIVARIGGDEFAVLFWDAEKPRSPNSRHPETAYALANRFRKAVEKFSFRSLGPEAKGVLTISGGLAAFPWDGQSCHELLRKADRALQEAKASGKNVIHLIGRHGDAEKGS